MLADENKPVKTSGSGSHHASVDLRPGLGHGIAVLHGRVRADAADRPRLRADGGRSALPRSDAEQRLAQHIFDSLVSQDEQQKLHPSLASSWENDGKNRWTFKLRDGVTFSNGKPFTAEDVVFTFCRTLKNETKVSDSFADVTGNFASVEAPDPKTLVITTTNPEPLLPNLLSALPILSASIVEHGPISYDIAKNCGVTGAWPTVSGFNDGTLAIGTGPYKLKSIRAARRSSSSATRAIGARPSPGPMCACCRCPMPGRASPPARRRLRRDREPGGARSRPHQERQALRLVITPSTRVIYFQLDVARDQSPFVKAEDGKNPLKDVRVRKAMSLAIDRDAIVKRIMDGAAEPAYQYLPTGMFGTQAKPEKLAYDPAQAKKLLAEAGYEKGFQLTLSTTNDRYINDSQITQAVAQYLTQIGIKTEVDAMTRAIYFPRRAKKEFSWRWRLGLRHPRGRLLPAPVAADPQRGQDDRRPNYGGYKNDKFDALIREAITTLDDAKRDQLLQEAGKIVLADYAFIPIHFESGSGRSSPTSTSRVAPTSSCWRCR